MFDLGAWGEFLIIVLAILIFIGPKELPTLLRHLGRMTQKLKVLSANVRSEINTHLEAGEFEEYQKQINASVLKEEQDQKKDPKKPKQNDPENE